MTKWRSQNHDGAPMPYGSARDLPSYQELAQLIHGAKLLTRVVARDQRQQILDVEKQMKRLTDVVDAFYERLGSRNWIFHDLLSVDKVEAILTVASDADMAEQQLIELYRDRDATKWWTMRFRAHNGWRQRLHQIERARDHYDADKFDSCTLHLIAVMDGFVNDFQPDGRKGLHSRDPDDMAAWDSVVGHHMGLTNAMKTFTKTIKKRVDDEVFEVYRHGIMHGTVVNFDNVVVATKAWNMLFAVADWATATEKAAQPGEPKPTWRDIGSKLARRGAYRKYEKAFVPSTITPSNPDFEDNEVVRLASEFLGAWQHGRWGLVANFMPLALRGTKSDGECARAAKDEFERYDLTSWTITSMTYDQASTAEVTAEANVDGECTSLAFRMARWTADGSLAIPADDDAKWCLAVWAPRTYFKRAD